MTNIIMLIGDLGGGKTTLAKLFAAMIKQEYPDIPVISNIDLGDSAIKIEDTNKFLAMKLIKQDKRYAFVITDEAAQAGLESRGSGTKAAALESRVITLARKAHVDLVLISQLMSMLDKRAQWLANFYILCEARWDEGNETPVPTYFDYTIYNSKLEEIGGFELEAIDCLKYLWPGMDTDDVPFMDVLTTQWQRFYEITPGDEERFERIMGKKAIMAS